MTEVNERDKANHHSGLFALIVNWEGSEATRRTVESLLAGSVIPEQILVVDNGSKDDSVAELTRLANEIEPLTLIQSAENGGYGRAMNEAAAHALAHGSTQLLGLNNDVILAPDCLKTLLSDRSASAITCPVILRGTGPKSETWWAGGRLVRPWLRVEHDVSPIGAIARRERTTSSQFATGAFFLMSADVWSRLGGFDEEYFLYWEDIDLSVRARKLGITCECANRAVAWHAVSGSTGRINKFGSATSLYFDYRNRFLFHRKLEVPATERLLSTVFLLLRLARMSILSGVRESSSRGLVLAALRGAFDGIRANFDRRRPV